MESKGGSKDFILYTSVGRSLPLPAHSWDAACLLTLPFGELIAICSSYWFLTWLPPLFIPRCLGQCVSPRPHRPSPSQTAWLNEWCWIWSGLISQAAGRPLHHNELRFFFVAPRLFAARLQLSASKLSWWLNTVSCFPGANCLRVAPTDADGRLDHTLSSVSHGTPPPPPPLSLQTVALDTLCHAGNVKSSESPSPCGNVQRARGRELVLHTGEVITRARFTQQGRCAPARGPEN